MAQEQTYATGRRNRYRQSLAHPGTGKMAINKIDLSEYFGNIFFEPKVAKPFSVTETIDQFDVMATVKGGKSAQVDALVHGIARALQEINPEMRIPLKRARTLDPRPRAPKSGKNTVSALPAPASVQPRLRWAE